MATRMILASCAAMPDGDGDDAGLIEALAQQGVEARWEPWGGTVGHDEVVVPRATWDYQDHLSVFLHWCSSLPHLINPYRVISRNTDKRYLIRFAEAGLPVVPTMLHGPDVRLTDLGDDFVVKPVVGAGSRGAGRFGPDTLRQAQAHINHLYCQGLQILLQPYQSVVDVEGETSLVFFRGEYSHAFSKGPMLRGGVVDTGGAVYLAEELGATEPDARMVQVAREVLQVAAADARVTVEDLVYARVDLIRGENGPLLLELELTEPGLGFPHVESAALERFAKALGSALP